MTSGDIKFEQPVHRPDSVEISIVIPAFNEAQRIGKYLNEIHDYFAQKQTTHEILVVDDGSVDNTSQVVRDFAKSIPTLGLLTYAQNRGKGFAVRTGILNARGKQRMFADADGSTPIAEVEKLREKLKQGCDIAIGSRAVQGDGTKTIIRPHRRVIAAGFRALRNLLLPLDVVDSQCGFKLFTEAAAQKLFEKSKVDGMAFDVELLYLARLENLKVVEVPVNWTDSYPSTIRLWKDPFKMARDLLKIRALHRR